MVIKVNFLSEKLLANLNKEQQAAVKTTEGPLLIMAGAGSGKTRVLTHRIAYLMAEKHVAPWNILAITFTNKAAREMKERVQALLGGAAEEVWISTFHSMCVRILRRDIDRIGINRNFSILDTTDQLSVIKNILKEKISIRKSLSRARYSARSAARKTSCWLQRNLPNGQAAIMKKSSAMCMKNTNSAFCATIRSILTT